MQDESEFADRLARLRVTTFESKEKSNGSNPPALSDLQCSLGLKPRFEVRESHDSFLLLGTMPGLRKEELSIELVHGSDGCILEISGASLPFTAANQSAHGAEPPTPSIRGEYAKFERRARLPQDADLSTLVAKYQDGLLTVTVRPRSHTDPPRRQKVEIL